MNALTCNCCGGSGFYFADMQCVRCNGKGVITAKRIKHLIERYYPRKLANGNISREVFAHHIFELREMLAKMSADPGETLNVELIAKAIPLDAAMCAKHGIHHGTTMLEMKKKFPAIYVEEF